MSKVDALRALREARYARIAASAPPKASPAPRKAVPTAAPSPAGTPVPVAPDAATCGHRNMSGRACTRESDHVKAGTKNHRYA